MPGPIHLYVSSSAGLVVEREAIGQIVAGLPLTLGWQVSHTPLPGSLDPGPTMGELKALVHSCDLYALVLGGDLSAPMGFEVRSLLTGGRRPFGAYRKECGRSPSAQDAVRTLDVGWQPFATLAAFRAAFVRDLLRVLLDVGPALGLDLADVERLMREQRGEGIRSDSSERSGDASDSRGAGQSGRILGREVWHTGEPD